MKIKFILLLILAALSLGSFAVAASAHDAGKTGKAKVAHYYIQSYSEDVWYSWFSNRCGNGTLWRCDWRGRPYCGILQGIHSRWCQYSWGESFWNGWGWNYRRCELNGRIEHATPMSWDERC